MKKIKQVVASFIFMMALCTMFSTKVFAADPAPSKVTGVKQVEAGSTQVKIAWDVAAGCQNGYYAVQTSMDGVTWTTVESHVYGCDTYLSSLTKGMSIYVRVAAYAKSAYSDTVLGEYSDPLEVITQPEDVTGVTQTGATTDSVTIAWNPVAGASYYQVRLAQTDYPVIAQTNETSVTIGGLTPNYKMKYTVNAVKQSASGFAVASTVKEYDWYGQCTEVKTVPGKMNKEGLAISSISYSGTSVYFTCAKPDNIDGVEYELRQVNKNKKVWSGTQESGVSCKKNVAYKYRVRAYVTVGDQKVYGAWSGYRYFVSGKAETSVKGKSISATWSKNKNVSKCKVYISTAEKTGYKKVKEVKGSKNSLVIKKIGKKNLKKGQTYYVKIVYVIKDGKKSYTSDICSVGSVHIY